MSCLTDKKLCCSVTGRQRAVKLSTWESASMGLRSTLGHSLPSRRRHSRVWWLIMLCHLRISALLRIPVHGGGGIVTRVAMRDCRTLHGRSIRVTLINHVHSTCAASLHRESRAGNLSIATTCFATMGLMSLSRSSLGTSAVWMSAVVGSMGRKGRNRRRAGVAWSAMMRRVTLLGTGKLR